MTFGFIMPVYESELEKTNVFWLEEAFTDNLQNNLENKSPNESLNSVNTSVRSSADDTGDEQAVDDLVATLKHKLQLKSSSSFVKHRRSASAPYNLESRTRTRRAMLGLVTTPDKSGECHLFGLNKKQVSVPCQMMRDLLQEGSLIKEAVKRLQMKSRTCRNSNELDVTFSNCDIGSKNSN